MSHSDNDHITDPPGDDPIERIVDDGTWIVDERRVQRRAEHHDEERILHEGEPRP